MVVVAGIPEGYAVTIVVRDVIPGDDVVAGIPTEGDAVTIALRDGVAGNSVVVAGKVKGNAVI